MFLRIVISPTEKGKIIYFCVLHSDIKVMDRNTEYFEMYYVYYDFYTDDNRIHMRRCMVEKPSLSAYLYSA